MTVQSPSSQARTSVSLPKERTRHTGRPFNSPALRCGPRLAPIHDDGTGGSGDYRVRCVSRSRWSSHRVERAIWIRTPPVATSRRARRRWRRSPRVGDGSSRDRGRAGADHRGGASGADGGKAMTTEAEGAADYVQTEAPRLIRVASVTAISFALFDGANRALSLANQEDVHDDAWQTAL
jgi:hypothetical protein